MIIRVLLFFSLLIVIFTNVYHGFLNIVPSQQVKTYNVVWMIIGGLFVLGFIWMGYFFSKGVGQQTVLVNIIMSMNFLILIPIVILSLFLLVTDFGRLLTSVVSWFTIKRSVFPMVSAPVLLYKVYAYIGLTFAVLILFGSTFWKYMYKVREHDLYFKELPAEFEGFTVVQISDIHTGSFDSKSGVQKGIELVNEQNPDIITFTGDLVNVRAAEAVPWIPYFSQLKAKYGKFSVMGNHDYAEYGNLGEEFKKANFKRLQNIHKEMGFSLLLNTSHKLSLDSSYIYICGVENWGLPPFPTHGDLDSSLLHVSENDFKILLSHDPSHWDAEVKKSTKNVQLTLSGHTHGMQFGFELPGFKWSPVSLKYPKWAGLYSEKNRFLYVNRGFGFIGYPGRVGIRPEITVIRLHKAAD